MNHQLRGEIVLVLVSLLMLAAAFSMLRRRGAAGPPTSFQERYRAVGWARLVVVGLGVGFLTGFFGVGGGFLIVPSLVLVIGLPMHLAVGTSLVAISLNSLWGIVGNLRLGGLDWTLTALFGLGGVVGVLTGGKLAGRLPDRSLHSAFAVVIVGVALYTFGRSVSALITG